jgi:transposase-like protein
VHATRWKRGAHGERPPEFKARAADLCRSCEGLRIADAARELGIGTKTFRKGARRLTVTRAVECPDFFKALRGELLGHIRKRFGVGLGSEG